MATESAWSRFQRWRRTRPFWGGLFLLLSALELFLSANLTLQDMQVHFGQEGYLSYVLPAVLVLCGVLAWVTPAQRLFYGIIGVLTALYSFLGLNLGGFGIGMLLGIVGGALTIAWGPPRVAHPPSTEDEPDTPAEADGAELDGEPDTVAESDAADDGWSDRPAAPSALDGEDAIAGSDLPPRSPYVSDPPTEILPGFDDRPGESRPPSERGAHRKLFVITLVPLVVTAAVLAGGSRSPARAADCPDGMPSRPAAEARKELARQATRATNKQATAKPRSSAAKAPAKTTPQEDETADPEGSPTPTPSPSDGTGNPIVDGLNNLVDGVGKLLGIGGDPSPSPSPSASPSPSTSPSTSQTPAPPAPGDPAPGNPAPGTPSGPSSDPSASASPSPTPSLPDVPCLGPRVLDKQTSPGGVPAVSVKGGLLEGKLLQMYDSTYDGTVDLQTADGPLRSLKFSMSKSVTKPFSLTIPEPGGHTTLIKSNALTTDGDVKFYTPSFSGKLFGLIPVTFTPDSPPPLTLPYLWFTDVKIHLAFVSCNTLTADPLDLTEKA
ncbi:MAG TPA: DUF6114 domain-containing protein [Actinoplanes sp.]|nr:DUF6114 domain-containing protein [Actinoplanes sp.]